VLCLEIPQRLELHPLGDVLSDLLDLALDELERPFDRTIGELSKL
jgi:hypothetical protein